MDVHPQNGIAIGYATHGQFGGVETPRLGLEALPRRGSLGSRQQPLLLQEEQSHDGPVEEACKKQ